MPTKPVNVKHEQHAKLRGTRSAHALPKKSPRSDSGMRAVSCVSVAVANCQVPCCTGRTKVISPLQSVT
jgi:hypothetical protein